jgi:hypothetical protein
VVADQLRCIDPALAEQYASSVEAALVVRELFSYKFPGEGIDGQCSGLVPSFESTAKLCSTIAEIAQFYSEILEREFDDAPKRRDAMIEAPLRRYFEYHHQLNQVVFDDDDYYRLWHATRKIGRPLLVTATKGLVEDFFGAWESEDAGEEAYDPDQNWQLIFPLE